ncbi:tRNA wybutosine-synthesizing protein 3 homolog [Saccostrea echinata]|uniref:tRNA wybutosine-synthesizing protein 3 homolog n=1 Tax=Saccostrea echinata TaxID=191078 RepID=UPI002A82A38A|nr:tRNA wybutosine-synthesizing protein 3 homolog [Saccostrea echinata]
MNIVGHFDRDKERALTGVDLSRKGSIDARIQSLVSVLNTSTDFFTTSSCSGRIIIFDDDNKDRSKSVKKKGCQWLYTTHDEAVYDAALESLQNLTGDSVLKFEPFVLHVQCRSLSNAQSMLSCAVASGFRNSGISIGNKGKIIVAVRSTHGLEVPLSQDGELLVTNTYIERLIEIANTKIQENFLRIDRFYKNVSILIETLKHDPISGNIVNKPNVVKKKKKCEKIEGRHHADHSVKENSQSKEPSEIICEDLSQCSLFESVT